MFFSFHWPTSRERDRDTGGVEKKTNKHENTKHYDVIKIALLCAGRKKEKRVSKKGSRRGGKETKTKQKHQPNNANNAKEEGN